MSIRVRNTVNGNNAIAPAERLDTSTDDALDTVVSPTPDPIHILVRAGGRVNLTPLALRAIIESPILFINFFVEIVRVVARL